MLTWMLYVVCITLLLSGAAIAAERAARLRRARSRWIWVLTILASLAIPTVIASVSIQVPSLVSPTVSRKITALRGEPSVLRGRRRRGVQRPGRRSGGSGPTAPSHRDSRLAHGDLGLSSDDGHCP